MVDIFAVQDQREVCNKFIEGYLTGIAVDQLEKKIELSLQEPTGRCWVLTATNVSEFMVLQMRMQNIIDRISIWDSSSSDTDYRDKVFCLFHGKFANEKDDFNSPLISRTIEAIKHGNEILLELDPVYGAIVLMLIKQKNIERTSGSDTVLQSNIKITSKPNK